MLLLQSIYIVFKGIKKLLRKFDTDFYPGFMIVSMLLIMFLFLLTGYPVAFTISGVPLLYVIWI